MKHLKRIFIIGCPRSGTTLLQNLLYNIVGSFPIPETFFFHLLINNNYVTLRSLPPFMNFKYPEYIELNTFERIIKRVEKDINFHLSKKLKSDVLKQIQTKSLKVKDFFDLIMLSYSKNNNDNIIIEKTPIHTYHLSYIKRLFPDAIFLNIVRDPRDVFVSFNKMIVLQGKKTRTVAEFCYLWNKMIKIGIKFNLNTIKYEDLIKNPLTTINNNISKYNLSISDIKKNSFKEIVRPDEIWKEKARYNVLADNTNKFNNILSNKEIAYIDYFCRKGMKNYGYKSECIKISYPFIIMNIIKWNIEKCHIWLNIFYIWIRTKKQLLYFK